MKKLFKILGVVLVATFLLVTVSCGEDDELIKTGGTIEVTNGLANNAVAYVIIAKGADYTSALADLQTGGGTIINNGETKTFSFDEDGTYTVCAMAVPPISQPLPKPVILSLGINQKVTIQ